MSAGSLETKPPKQSEGAMVAKCLFVDQLRGKKERPCRKCAALSEPIGGECYETASHFEWWAVETKDGRSIFFRCFPKAKSLPRTPKARANYVRREYRAAMREARGRNEFRDRKKRNTVWNVASVNALFGRILPAEIKRFRPACACEIAAWLAGHKSDFLAMKNGEEIIERLESFV